MQEPQLNEEKTVRGNVEEGVPIKAKLNRFNEVAELMATDYTDELMEEMGKLQEELDAADAWDIDSQLEQAMDALRCPPPDDPVTHLSGGERRRVALCKLLLSKPDLLLLDEPTNHLDAESVQWLEAAPGRLQGRHPGRHPRSVLPGQRRGVDSRARPWPGLPVRGQLLDVSGEEGRTPRSSGQEGPEAAEAAQGRTRLGALGRQGPPGQEQGPPAALRRDGRPRPRRPASSTYEEIQIPVGPRLGNLVVEVENLDKGFDGRILIKDLSFTLPRNGIVGVIGPNGVGKTTLFKTIVGLEEPDSGIVKVGETVKLSYVDQGRSQIDPKKNVWEVVSDGLDYIEVGQTEVPVAGLRVGVRVQGTRSAEAGRGAVRR